MSAWRGGSVLGFALVDCVQCVRVSMGLNQCCVDGDAGFSWTLCA